MVAVKKSELKKQKKRVLDTFKREIRALSKINHDNVVKLIGCGIKDNLIYSVMEFCKGGVNGY